MRRAPSEIKLGLRPTRDRDARGLPAAPPYLDPPLAALLGKLGCEAVAVRLVLGLQLLQGPEQLPGLAGVVTDALALLDQAELALLMATAVPDGVLSLCQQSLGG